MRQLPILLGQGFCVETVSFPYFLSNAIIFFRNNAPKRPRISVTDSFTLPSNSSYASTSKSTNTKICAFNVSGTVAPVATVIKKTFEKVQVIDNNLLLMQEYMVSLTILLFIMSILYNIDCSRSKHWN